jgi:HPt (histidine-containing phosphotransfer) domain-containing protein
VGVDRVGASQKLQPFEVFSTNGRVAVLDISYLNRVTFGDLPLRGEIIGLFLAQVNGLAGRLELPLDAVAWQFLTHTLKGAGSAVGATHIAEIASAWEHRLVPQTVEARTKLSSELKAAILEFEKAASNLH